MNRRQSYILQGLIIAVAFFLGLYAPTALTYFNSSSSTRESAKLSDTGARQALKGLGYASGYERREGPTGVLKHDSPTWNGYNVYTSAHRTQAVIMDMSGDTIHTWQRSFEASFPSADLSERTRRRLKMRPWRKIYPYPNGDLLAIHSSYGIVKLDRHSNLLWSRHNVQHHDMDVGPDGRVYTIASKRAPRTFEGVEKQRLIDTITVYSDTGLKLDEYDLLRALERSKYRGLMGFFGKDQNELFHTNSVDVLPDGDLLLSILHLHSLARLDLETRRFEWMLTGRTSHQHDAQHIGVGSPCSTTAVSCSLPGPWK